jgi:deoxycytidylate deaminase
VATGYNHHTQRNKLGKWTIHAEMDALNKIKKPSSNITAFIYRKNAKIITPCLTCSKLLKSYGIKVVWHTIGFEKEVNKILI